MNVGVGTYQTMRREIGEGNVYYLDEIKIRKLHVSSKAASLYMCGFEIFRSLKGNLQLIIGVIGFKVSLDLRRGLQYSMR